MHPEPFPSRRPTGAARLHRHGRAWRALRVAPLVTCVLLASAPLVLAQRPAPPQPWPQERLVVEDLSGWTSAVRAAVEQWNAADVGLTLRLARPGEPAQVRILSDAERVRRWCAHVGEGCRAFASRIGAGDGSVDIVLPEPAPGFARDHPGPAQVRLVAHELGHAMGLEHTHEPCAVMNPNVNLPGCRRIPPTDARPASACGPLAPDVREAVALYGGRGAPQIHCRP